MKVLSNLRDSKIITLIVELAKKHSPALKSPRMKKDKIVLEFENTNDNVDAFIEALMEELHTLGYNVDGEYESQKYIITYVKE